jgi:LacI family transcriptional regulator
LASMSDVARLAGVSIPTVSKVVNNYPDVSPETRQKVMRIIDELNYFPNVMARGLVKGRSWTIGIFTATPFGNPFLCSAMTGMRRTLENTGYDLIFLTIANKDPDYNFVNHCHSRNVEGVVAFGFGKDSMQLCEQLLKSDIPCVFIDINYCGERSVYITSDNKHGILLAVNHLHKLGHTRIGYISPIPYGYPHAYITQTRFEGFQEALFQNELTYRDDYVYFTSDTSFSKKSGFEMMQRMLLTTERPTAVLCASDTLALGAYEAIEQNGLNIPNDIAIVGFDDSDLCELVRPKLTSVRQDIVAIGEKSIEILIETIENASYSPQETVMPTHLIVRDSCGAERIDKNIRSHQTGNIDVKLG